MNYRRTVWKDGETRVNAENLNKLEAGVEQAHALIESTRESHDELNNVIRTWGPIFDSATGNVIMTPVVQGFNTK